MPIKSKAQRRKFAQLLLEGKISEPVYEEWNRGAGSKELPERLHPKKDEKRTRRSSSRASGSSRKRKATAKQRTAKRPATRKRVTKRRVTRKNTASKKRTRRSAA